MLVQAGINLKQKEEFSCEVISPATNLDNIMVRPDRIKTAIHFILQYGRKVYETFEIFWRNGSRCLT